MIILPEWPAALPAKISLIGEAPAEMEEVKGRPFSGPSGKILNGCLRQIELSRWDCHLSNVFNERLEGEEVGSICVPRAEAHELLKQWEEVAGREHPYRVHCLNAIAAGAYLPCFKVIEVLDRLRLELDHAGAHIVVALGGTAVWALLGMAGHGTVSRVRGALSHEVLTGRKCVAAYHPAAVARNPKLRQFLLSDLTRAKEEADNKELVLAERKLLIPTNPQEVNNFLARECNGWRTAVDIETMKGQIDSICFTPNRFLSMSVPIWHPKTGNYWTSEDELKVVNYIAWFMENDTPKVFQYGPQYDVQWLWEHWRIATRGTIDDTRLMMHAMHPDQDKDLASIGGTYERLGPWKMMRKAAKSTKRDD